MFSFPFIKKKPLLNLQQEEQIVEAIRFAEKETSGEVRVYIESKCRFVDPVDRAIEIFFGLKMDKTDNHNAVLVYVALKDKQLAIYADEGIYTRMGKNYWNDEVVKMIGFCKQENIVNGISLIVKEIGKTLQKEYPYKTNDKNELPDAIVFGK